MQYECLDRKSIDSDSSDWYGNDRYKKSTKYIYMYSIDKFTSTLKIPIVFNLVS